MRSFAQDFKEFIMRGNVVDLAVAVVIGAAFTIIVNAFVADLITPLLAAIGGQPDFSDITFTINGSRFLIGDFINVLISFLIIAAVVFFFVVKPMNMLVARATPEPEGARLALCPECLREISPDANRCPHCTTWLRGANVAVS